MARLLIVDDVEIERIGRTVAIERSGHRAVGISWGELTGHPLRLLHPTLVILVLRREVGSWDRYYVLREAQDLRSAVGQAARMVAVVGRRSGLNPLLGLRLAGSGVTEVLDHRDLASVRDLEDLIAGHLRGSDPVPSNSDLASMRVGRRSDPTRVIDRILSMAASDPSYLRAFDPGLLQNECGLSRRRAHTLRVKVSELGDLLPSTSYSNGGPLRDLSLPRWTDMVAFVNLCRGWDPDDEQFGLVVRRDQVGLLDQTADLAVSS